MAEENGNGVRISNREIYDAVMKLERRIGRLEVAFFGILAGMGTVLGKLLG